MGYARPNLQKQTPNIRGRNKNPPYRRGKEDRGNLSSVAGERERFKTFLAKPVSGASLAAFRIAVGLVMALEAYALCVPNLAAITTGTSPLETYYTGQDIRFHFPYEAFEWLPLLPAHWIYALVGILALAGVTMALGFCYRVSAATVFLTWAYLWLVESTRTYWQSHYYLECLLTFLLIWMPAARRYSVDAWLARRRNPPRTVPYWTVLLLRLQLVIAYFYAGVAKLNTDWLLDAVPVRWFLARPGVTAPFEPFLTAAQVDSLKGILHSVEFAYFISYAGAMFDLSVGFLLLIRRTRIFALILMVLFHATNHFLIFDDIGWFPLVGATTALIFLDTDWPERCRSWLRRPRLAGPDWNWFAVGAILFPIVGAALGWKLRASSPPAEAKKRDPLGRCAASFMVVWLVWQALLPIRQYAIPGDGRFTYEGNSFSWRLKAEMRHSFGQQMFLKDVTIVSRDETTGTRINWNEWHGDKVIYRRVTPGRINWQMLPEIVVLVEPILGERIVYNPFAGSNTARTEEESRERVRQIWRELYAREPQAVRRTMSLPQVLDSVSEALRAGGHGQEAARLAGFASRTKQLDPKWEQREAIKAHSDVLEMLRALHSRDEKGAMIPFLRPVDPFGLEGERRSRANFLLIEDPELFDRSRERPWRVNRNAWNNGPYTRDQSRPSYISLGGEPLVIYMGFIGLDERDMLPQAYLLDSQDHPEEVAAIRWNSLKDLTYSKFLHTSVQAFYLRRYARRVASLWEKEYGRRPTVHGLTKVSLNGRPHQLLVDPDADLASVPVRWFGHNHWIKDLETPRIPREALAGASGMIGP